MMKNQILTSRWQPSFDAFCQLLTMKWQLGKEIEKATSRNSAALEAWYVNCA
jgi:hypothetical protein